MGGNSREQGIRMSNREYLPLLVLSIDYVLRTENLTQKWTAMRYTC